MCYGSNMTKCYSMTTARSCPYIHRHVSSCDTSVEQDNNMNVVRKSQTLSGADHIPQRTAYEMVETFRSGSPEATHYRNRPQPHGLERFRLVYRKSSLPSPLCHLEQRRGHQIHNPLRSLSLRFRTGGVRNHPNVHARVPHRPREVVPKS